MRDQTLQPLQLLGDVRLLVILFIAFRFLLLLVYQPILLDDGTERGIGTGGDRLYHYTLAALSDDEAWPFRDWWSEFPPIWYTLTTGVYLLLGENANYTSWSLMLGLIMLASEVGNLLLLRAIGTRLHGAVMGMALAWIYALTLAPVVFMWWNFDSLVTLALLTGLWFLLQKHDSASAVAAGVGALVKFVPVLLLGAVIRFRQPRQIARYVALTLGVFALAYLPLFAVNAELTAVSLTAQFGKPSYQTVWALIDGNYTTGNFGSIESHFTPEGVNEVEGHPAVVPGWLRLGVAALIGLFVFLRTRRLDDIGLVAFVSITLLIFYLQSQGWSPQWLTQIIPLTLLVFPTRNGVYVTILLSVLAFAEYPFLFIRTGETGGEITGPLVTPFAVLVIARTLILVLLTLALYFKLRQEPIPEHLS